MNTYTIKALAMELYKNEEVAIALANEIFELRDSVPEKFEFKFEKNNTYLMSMESFTSSSSGDILSTNAYGRYRKTQEGAELSLKRNQRANRLEMLVEYLGGLKEFVDGEENWYVYCHKGEYCMDYDNFIFSAEKVYMTKEVAIKVCKLLNSGAYSLDGDN
jgi:hypothetical protein